MCIRSDRFSQLDLHLERKNQGKEMYDEINKVCDYYENVTNGYKYNCDSLYGNDYCSQYATTHGGLLSRYDVELWDIDNQPNCGMEVWSDRVVEKTKDRYNNHKFVDLRSANVVNFTGRIDNPSTIFVNLINFEEDPGFRSITNPWLSQSITRDSRSIFNNAMNKIRADETRIAWTFNNKRLAAEKAENQLVIIDRHWISECAYAEIYRRGSCYPVGARCLDRLLIKLGATTIMCIRSDRFSQLDLHLERKIQSRF